MLLLKASIAAGIAVAIVIALTGLVDGVDAFLIGSGVTGAIYALGALLKPSTSTSIMTAPTKQEAGD